MTLRMYSANICHISSWPSFNYSLIIHSYSYGWSYNVLPNSNLLWTGVGVALLAAQRPIYRQIGVDQSESDGESQAAFSVKANPTSDQSNLQRDRDTSSAPFFLRYEAAKTIRARNYYKIDWIIFV